MGRKMLALWAVCCLACALCVLPASAGEEKLLWTREELAAAVGISRSNNPDILPRYAPAAPAEATALFVTSLRANKEGGLYRARDTRAYIQERLDGLLRFTGDPNEASLLFYYQEWDERAGAYGSEGKLIAYGGYARLTLVFLTEEGAEPVVAEAVNWPTGHVSTPMTAGNYYLDIPVLEKDEDMAQLLSMLFERYNQDEGLVSIGSLAVPADTKSLSFEGETVTEKTFQAISRLTELEELDMAESGVGNLSPLSGLTRLRMLNATLNDLRDLRPLSGLSQLTSLELPFNSNIKDYAPLSGLSQLTYLDLRYNYIGDISPLSGLVNLQTLQLKGNAPYSLVPLSGLSQLETLSVDVSNADIEPLSALVNLQTLDLEGVTDISTLAGLTNLRGLGITGDMTDLSPLSSLVHLERLTLKCEGEEAVDLSPLLALPSLQNVFLEMRVPPSEEQQEMLEKAFPDGRFSW